MTEATMNEFIDHAKRAYPREACGLVLNVEGKERYFACKNVAEELKDFIIDPRDFVAAEDSGDIIAVVHSHPNSSPKPSQADLAGCEANGIPWFIYSLSMGTWERIEPSGYRAPLLGREFSHGVHDCYALVRDFYFSEYGVEILDFERKDKWWEKGENLLLDNFPKAGFEEVKGPIKRGDVIFMQIGASVANHAAVYLGDGLMIHHASNRLSCREVYGGWWDKMTRMIVRHKGLA